MYVFSKGIVRNDETKPDRLSAGTGGTMLARINKHIPRASELRMVILFLITNTISCPAWDIMQITGDVGFCSADVYWPRYVLISPPPYTSLDLRIFQSNLSDRRTCQL